MSEAYTSEDLMSLAIHGGEVDPFRIAATYAKQSNWGRMDDPSYGIRWYWKGPVICAYELASWAKEPSSKPPASEGVRLSVDEAIFKIEDYVGGNIEGVDTIDRMSFTRFLRQNLESLAALPELEKRECLACGGGEFKNITTHCKQCNGHGEVWVRKAGV